MKATVKSAAIFLLGLVAVSYGQSNEDIIAAARTACASLDWPFDAATAKIDRSQRDPNLVFVHLRTVSVTLYGPNLALRSVENSGYETARRQHSNRKGPFVADDAAWYGHGVSLAHQVWPQIALRGTRVEHFGKEDMPLRASDSRTVRLTFEVIGPVDARNRVTIILDRDEGKVIYIDNWPLRPRR